MDAGKLVSFATAMLLVLVLSGCIGISGVTGGETTPTPPTCPSGCSAHGTCVSGVCVCTTGWSGIDCSISSMPTPIMTPSSTPAPTATPTAVPSATPIPTLAPGGCGSDADCRANQFCNTTARMCACRAGWGNCDMIIENGCEANLYTSVTQCGDCARVCSGGQACVMGACVTPKKPDGALCAAGSECISGTCYPAQTGKRCAPGGMACPACKVINEAGASCTTAMSGTDPKDECPATEEASCGTTGNCNGGGACQMWGHEAVCSAGSCANFRYNEPGRCNGAGACAAGAEIFCDDNDMCTTDDCSPTAGCVHTTVSCDDGNECTVDSCVPNHGCSYAPAPQGTRCTGGICQGTICTPG